MPYIPKPERARYDGCINDMVELLVDKLPGENGKRCIPGNLNYVISSIVWKIFNKSKSYTHGNELMGVLCCIKEEFYRRQLAIYEDLKLKENDDII